MPDLLTILQRHVGAANGITVARLSRELGIAAREVRRKVAVLREEGVAVCGHPKSGYYIAATPAELEETCQFLRARALHSLRLASRLSKIPLPDLIGQLHLNT